MYAKKAGCFLIYLYNTTGKTFC